MSIKKKKESLRERLEHDENAWLKLLGSMGDFAKYCRNLAAKEELDRKHIKKLEHRIDVLEKDVIQLRKENPVDEEKKRKSNPKGKG